MNTLKRIPTAAEVAALTDAEATARAASGPVISLAEVGPNLDAGHRVYALTADRSAIARIYSAANAELEASSFAGFFVGASSVPIGRA